MRFKLSKRGLTGLSTLILLIAILLAVAVTALALISTSQSLVRRDEQTAKEKTQHIQHPIIVEMVRAWDSDQDKLIDRLSFVVRLHWGDEPINFNRTVVIIDSDVVNCTSMDYGPDALTDCAYTITYMRQGSDWEQDYLHAGDLVELRFTGTNLITGVEDLTSKFTFIPSHGLPTELKCEIPRRIYPRNMELWPLND
jgi:hypothetical protein